jgi:hypothetical protein
MPDERTAAPTPVANTAPGPQSGPTINIGAEFGTAKRNLPPVKIVASAVFLVLILVGIVAYLQRAKPQAAGSLDNVTSVDIPGQSSTMAALTFTLRNTTEKTLYVKTIQGQLKTATGESTADAVSAIDFDRYFQAFPALKSGTQPALTPEAKLQPGETVTRTVIVAFPVPLDAFGHRQSVSVVIQPYDQSVPVVFTK